LSALLSQGNAVQIPNMKRRDDQITLRLAGSLRAELERAAAEDGRSLSNLIRAVLADFAAQRVVDRATQAAA
jgi:predicted HicB family RNase H-like nuclease